MILKKKSELISKIKALILIENQRWFFFVEKIVLSGEIFLQPQDAESSVFLQFDNC